MTAVNVTDDLRTLLQARVIPGPVVLVGHSIGGFYATFYAGRLPENVEGLVLVKSGFSGQEQWRTTHHHELEFTNISRGRTVEINDLLTMLAIQANKFRNKFITIMNTIIVYLLLFWVANSGKI